MEESVKLESVPELERFLLKNVKRPGEKPKKLGTGSYGSVEALEDGGITCAGKTLHDALIDVQNKGVENITKKFIKECQLLGDLRHPHIVQFLGICFLPDSQLPVLVMEYLTTSLDHLLQKSVSLSIKTSILYDVARGLAYLHCHSPPVIHRDLTATNVLLNSAMVAKIADFGNARIVDISPNQLAQTMTRAPGTTAYLPPEALEPHPKYNSKIDIFSFGHLSLYTVIQEFPMPTASTYTDPDNKAIVARSETERRQRFIDKMEQQLILSPLKQLIVECLCNDPDQRPSTERAVQQLAELQSQVTDPYWDMGKLEMMKAMEEKQQQHDSEAKRLQSQIVELEKQQKELKEKWTLQLQLAAVEVKTKSEPELEKTDVQLAQMKSELALCQSKDKILKARATENQQQAEIIQHQKAQLEKMEDICQTKDEIIAAREAESQQQTKMLEQYQAECEEFKAKIEANSKLWQNVRKEQEEQGLLKSRVKVLEAV